MCNKDIENISNINRKYKCHLCTYCDGKACVAELPGMGGVKENKNFILNVKGWDIIYKRLTQEDKFLENTFEKIKVNLLNLSCAPVTGAEENIGYNKEKDFYLPYVEGSFSAGIEVCIGDGVPDDKLTYGVEAVEETRRKFGKTCRATYFLKPREQEVIFSKCDLVKESASYIGVDIDSYNIVTMKGKVKLEKKTARQLKEIRSYTKLPLAVKGVFTTADIELCREVLPDIIVISNHGGRIDTEEGSTAEFLFNHYKELLPLCHQLWVDGGIRKRQDVAVSLALGAKRVLVGRPFISATILNKEDGIMQVVNKLLR